MGKATLSAWGRRLFLIALLLAMTGAVTSAQLRFMRNMFTSPVVQPQVAPRVPVEDTIPVDGTQILDKISSIDLPNPRPNTPEVLQEGAWLYGVYCAVCHGADGQGDGQIAEHFRRMPSMPSIQNRTDGLIYAIIREGGANMPAFADTMSVDERWALVHFIRTFRTPE
ncbi:MAG: cytochrome c [Vicinamibacterales bacterium]|nr:cytochrome c [Vicinamibacterales bacterium]